MKQSEITLRELIEYFDGTASLSLIYHIENQLLHDQEFARELDNWIAFIQEHSTYEEGLNQIKSLYKAWQYAELPPALGKVSDE